MWRRFPLIGIIVLLWWISFIPETVQFQYRNIVKYTLGILLLLSILAHKTQLRHLLFEKQDILLWLYLLTVVACGIFFAKERLISLGWFYRFFLPIPFLYLLIKNETNEINGLVIAKSLCFFGCVVTLIGLVEFTFRKNLIYEYLIYNPYYYRFLYSQPRLMSTLLHPAALGSYLIVCLAFSFFLITIGNRHFKSLGLLCAVLFILGIILTFSRGSLLGMFTLLWVYFWRKNRKLFIKIFIIGAITLFIICSILSERSGFQRFGFKGLTKKSTYQHKTSRIYLTYKMLKDHPFSGLGLEHYRFLFDKYYGSSEVSMEWKIPDNMYLAILGETGIIGLSTFLIFVGFLFKMAYRYFRSTDDKNTKELFIATTAGIIGLMVNFLTYDLLYWTTPLYLFWIFVGMVSGLIKTEGIRSEIKYAQGT